jgi:hypothetical protein
MPRKRIPSTTRNIVIRQYKLVPFCGVRELSLKLKKDHGIVISKSSISNILKNKGLKQTLGRKEARPRYLSSQYAECGLFLLRALDSHLGLIENIALQISPIFSGLSKETLKKILIFIAFSQFCGKDFKKSRSIKDFLRLSGFSRAPVNSLNYFHETLIKHKLVVDLSSVIANTQLVSTVKFVFNNGSVGFSDAQLTTFWDDCCRFERFFSPIKSVILKLSRMIKDKVFIIGYTKSFGFLSPTTSVFIKGVSSGIKRIEIMDTQGKSILEIPLKNSNISFLFGYSPRILDDGIKHVSGSNRIRKVSTEKGFEFYGKISQVRIAESNSKNYLFLSNTVITDNTTARFNWGIFSTAPKSRSNFLFYIRRYLYVWKYVSDDFFKDMEAIEKSAFGHEEKCSNVSRMLPKKLVLCELKDFAKIGQILSILFKEIVGPWEPKAKKGSWRVHKEAIYVHLDKIPEHVKKSFNKSSFCMGKKPIIIV